MEVYQPHPFRPENKSTIHRIYDERCWTKCPIPDANVTEKEYIGTFVDYTFINKKGKPVYVERYCLVVKWVN